MTVLSDRSLLRIEGADAEHLIDRLVTSRTPVAGDTPATASALLTPQGKILFDFLLVADDGGYWLDVRSDLVADLLKRLTFYKLRADVTLTDRSSDVSVSVSDEPVHDAILTYADPRAASLGHRAIVAKVTEADPSAERAYSARRIAAGIAEGGADFSLGDIFPHDAALDLIGAVDFRKGCFVGQEVVSRAQHRGTQRRRVLIASGGALRSGNEITAGGKPAGTLGTVIEGAALAIARLDRIANAQTASQPVLAGDSAVSLSVPPYATYSLGD
ncbi:MAG: folate-binding protein [Pseudomonadota bacterium]